MWEKHLAFLVTQIKNCLKTEKLGEDIEMRVTYSLHVLVAELEKFILLMLFFIVIDRWKDFLIAYGTIALLRVFTGGSHRKTVGACLFQTFININIILFFAKYLIWTKYMYLLFLGLGVAIVLYAPIQSEQRITYTVKYRRKFKKKAIIYEGLLLGLYLILPEKMYMVIVSAIFFHTLELIYMGTKLRRNKNSIPI